jgi:rSAM/selenodomain-associated transferase 2
MAMAKRAQVCNQVGAETPLDLMISVIIPTLNAQETLGATLAALVPAVVDGLVREVIVVDGGSTDDTERIVDIAGATFVTAPKGRGGQLAAGARAARFPWLLFLHADTVLQPGWEREAQTFIERIDSGRREPSAAAFRFALDDSGMRARLLEKLVHLRCLTLRLPYGDQGLLLPVGLYRSLGGFKDMPLMEDVDFVRRLGARRLTFLRSEAVTSAERYRTGGYLRRSLRNLMCFSLYLLRVPPGVIARLYG